MVHLSHHHDGAIFGANAAVAGFWVLDQVARYGPRWELVPAILAGLGSLIGAANAWARGAQQRRHAEAEHRARLGCCSTLRMPKLDGQN